MRKRLYHLFALLLSVVLFVFCGCGRGDESAPASGNGGEIREVFTPVPGSGEEIGEMSASDPDSGEETGEAPMSESSEAAEAESQAPYSFEYNPYAVTSDFEKVYGEAFSDLFEDFVTAYLNYETTIDCPSFEVALALTDTTRISFMLFQTDGRFDYDTLFDEEKKQMTWSYSTGSFEEHERAIDEFEEVVAGYIEPCLREGDNEIVRAVAIYRELSSRMTYNYAAMEEDLDVTPYNALINEIGICQSFAGAYVHLMLQVGIDANTVGGLTYDDSVAHEWCIVTLDGQNYYVDPTYENGETGGLGLEYFGMTTDERVWAGDYNPEYFNIGCTNEIWGSDVDVSDTRLEAFRACDTFEIDRESGQIICRESETGGEWEVSVAID